eukprot:6186898-Pleurochrysis_carterae.AAC.2
MQKQVQAQMQDGRAHTARRAPAASAVQTIVHLLFRVLYLCSHSPSSWIRYSSHSACSDPVAYHKGSTPCEELGCPASDEACRQSSH